MTVFPRSPCSFAFLDATSVRTSQTYAKSRAASIDGIRLAVVWLPEEGEPMKRSLLAIALFGLLVLGARDLRAQYIPYPGPYWDFQYQQYLQYQYYLQWQNYLEYLRQTDPYYELHVMHYQLYLQPYQPYQVYQPCCYTFGVPVRSFGRVVPHWARSRGRR